MDAGARDGGSAATGCQSGLICASNQCVACPTGQTACGNQCADLNTSDTHCGACGNACPAGQECVRRGDAGVAACQMRCTMGMTLCGGGCVPTASDRNNCGACGNDCARQILNADTACMNGSCRLAGCSMPFANCDGMESNGCETNTNTSTTHCGSCGNRCTLPNATAACVAGACAVMACNAGFGDCNNDPRDGCETNTMTAVAHCGRCGNPCMAPTGLVPLCNAGVCGSTMACMPPELGNCDGAPGCETNLTTSVMNCGGCGRACSSNGGVPSCTGASLATARCTIQCSAGFGDCDNNASNGCETNISTNVTHCGRCGNVCNLPNASESCVGGMCRVVSCNAGFANCDGRDDNGCEQGLLTDTANCGACGNRCRTGEVCSTGTCACPNMGDTYCPALSRCVNLNTDNANCGACGVACTGGMTCQSGTCRCLAGFTPCNGVCVDLQSNASHCNACGNVCALANARSGCTAGTCVVLSCNAGFGNCDGDSSDGCETNTNADNNHCSRCGMRCAAGTFCSNGTCVTCGMAGAPACQPGSVCTGSTNCGGTCRDTTSDESHCGGCGRACAMGQTCCGGTCRNLTTETANCGTCGNVCVPPANAAAVCNAGVCGLGACNAGFDNCDGNAANGCEVTLATNVAHCGTCRSACTTTNGTPGCTGGNCTVAACNSGFADCNRVASDGCEINTRTNPSHCNACGARCMLNNVATATCAAGVCGVGACTMNFGNCDGMAANGCEVNHQTDVNNCGACNARCMLANASANCTAGSCAIAACNMGFANCNMSATDGCETNTQTDNANCGMCGNACASGTFCSGGTCMPCGSAGVVVCPSGNPCNTGLTACGSTCRNLTTDNNNCGMCGRMCPLGEVCRAGACTPCGALTQPCCASGTSCTGALVCTANVCSCPTGQTNCSGTCRSLSMDTNNCGMCGRVCSFANASATCGSGTCAMGTCTTGFRDCNMSPTDGCEIDTQTSTTHCGTCGMACTAGARMNVTPACSAGACAYSCTMGFGDCDSDPTNGCETNTQTSPMHCGTCGGACAVGARMNVTPTCTTGTCSFPCAVGFADCDMNPANGCEADTQTSLAHCGGCNRPCGTTCTAGVCAP